MEKSPLTMYSEDLDRVGKEKLSNSELVELHKHAVRGDRKAWERLWMHGTRLVLKMVNHMSEANILRMEKQDAIAEGNAAIGEALLSWKPRKGSFGNWVWIITRNAVVKENGRHRVAFLTGMLDDAEVLSANEYGDWDLTEASSAGQSPEDGQRSAEQAQLLEEIKQLPPREQEYIIRHFLYDESQEDIAFAEGVSSAMVRKVISRGLEKIREKESR